MEKKIDDICRLCLKFEGTDFLSLDEYRITKLKVIIPDLDIDHNQSGHFMMCMKCKEALDNGYTLTRTIVDNQVLINTRKSKLNIEEKVVLDRLFNDKESGEPENNICRICLNMSTDTNSLFLDTLPEDDSFQDVLRTCFSNLDRDLVANPLVCSDCIDKAYEMYGLISGALVIDEKIKQFCESDPNNKNLDLNQVLLMLGKTSETEEGGENDFLSEFEVKDEEEMDIFDSIPVDNESSAAADGVPKSAQNNGNDHSTTRKRSLESTADPEVLKKAKMDMFLATHDLPNFKFNFNILYNTLNGMNLGEWLAIVDMQKKKFNWSDHTTIQKVLALMYSMPGVHTWFSSIGDIMTWDEWKTKLLKAFPDPDDYCLLIKKAIRRRKKPDETFVNYLKDKNEILEQANITGKNAVSCIIHGIAHTDALVYCLARIGGYETPQELVDYFKNCDEKAALSESATETSQKPVKMPKAEPKKIKGQCYKCLKFGHMAVACTQKPAIKFKPQLKSTPQFTRPKFQQMTATNKYPPVSCKFCKKFGHRTRVCPFAQVEKLKQNQHNNSAERHVPPFQQGGATFNQHTSTSQQPVTYPTNNRFNTPSSVQLSRKKCGYCHKYGHTSEECRIANRKAAANEQKWATKPVKAKWVDVSKLDPFETECAHCGSLKHLSRYCGKNKPNRKLAPDSEVERCRHCRSHGHASDACYLLVQENHSSGGSKYGDPSQQQLCYLCYQMGHKKANCPLNNKWSYRE